MKENLIKRLEIIKLNILLKDLDEVRLQISKLNSFNDDYMIAEIISDLQKNRFGSAMKKIQLKINSSRGLIPFELHQNEKIKLRIKVLEAEFADHFINAGLQRSSKRYKKIIKNSIRSFHPFITGSSNEFLSTKLYSLLQSSIRNKNLKDAKKFTSHLQALKVKRKSDNVFDLSKLKSYERVLTEKLFLLRRIQNRREIIHSEIQTSITEYLKYRFINFYKKFFYGNEILIR